MITTLTKYQSNTTANGNNNKNSIGNGGIFHFELYLPIEIRKYLGKNIVVKKVDFGFTLRSSTLDDNSNLYTITKKGVVCLSNKNVNEWEDLGDYEIDPDYENKIVYLVKIKNE